MKCRKCSHEQESGKFCGACGAGMDVEEAAISSVDQTAATVQETAIPSNDNFAKAKEASNQYSRFAMNLLKKPALALRFDDTYFVQGLITIVIYLLAFALSIYFLVNKLYKTVMGGFGDLMVDTLGAQSLPFFEITFSLFFYTLLFVAGAVASVIIAAKLMKDSASVKQMIAQFGGLLVPFAGLNLIAVLCGLAGSIQLTLGLTGISLAFVVILLPALHVFERSTRSAYTEHKVYWSIGASSLSMFLAYLIVRTVVLDYVEKFDQMVNMF